MRNKKFIERIEDNKIYLSLDNFESIVEHLANRDNIDIKVIYLGYCHTDNKKINPHAVSDVMFMSYYFLADGYDALKEYVLKLLSFNFGVNIVDFKYKLTDMTEDVYSYMVLYREV